MSELAELVYILDDFGIVLPGRGSLDRQSLERELERFLDRIDDAAYYRGEDSVSHDECYESYEVEEARNEGYSQGYSEGKYDGYDDGYESGVEAGRFSASCDCS